MAINFSTLFGRIVKVADLLDNLKTYQATTIKTDADAILTAWSTLLTDTDSYTNVGSLVSAANSLSAQSSVTSACKSLIQSEIIRTVKADQPTLNSITITTALDEVVKQMVAGGQSVDNNACTVSVSSPSTKATFVVSAKHPDGTTTELAYAETFRVEWNGSALSVRGEPKIAATSSDWPDGSGISTTFSPAAIGGLIVNGAVDEEDTLAVGKPASWVVTVGTINTTIKMTDFETQTVTITGTPTSGYYSLTITDPSSNVQTTPLLAFDAAGSDVQAAIRSLAGFGSTEVTTTGTGPNYVHSIKFVGVVGDVPNITINSSVSPGSIAQANGAAVDVSGLTYRTMFWVGNGSQLTAMEQVITPQAKTQYAFHVRMKKQASATGVIEFRLIDGAGNVINDDAGVANSLSVNLTAVSSAAYGAHTAFFRLPSVLPTIVKFQVRLTTAINNTYKLYIDEMTLATVRQLGNTGLYAALFPGVAASATADAYTLSSTNDYTGRIQTLFMRFFDRQLPSSGSPTISDT
jgi:hypothetical protein